ncbi:MAG: WecB/TagA/CpsF family glycosyltransferase, partial [Candidatus Magasanikbacteria bacterium]|nr:WecB/TagA/CpsF family glycosyltransferase [Candidatus Magasanikbacteria bacterium]
KTETLEKIEGFLAGSGQHYLVTPNPEILLLSHQDEEFFYILNHADLSLPDGIGLRFSAWLLREDLYRITGVKLTEEILKIAEAKNYKVAVINWCCGLSSQADIEVSLCDKYPKLNFIVEDIERGQDISACARVQEFKPDVMFVALGAPHQEKFIYHNLNKVPSVKVALGIGGAFDFITGKTKRAPKLMRRLGVEWLWRLFSHPQDRWNRAKRIYNAVIVFTFKVLQWRFIMPFQYRPNVACLLYKKVGEKYQVLLVERKDEAGHWQLPQGGLDGLDLETAGAKELREEIGNEKFAVRASYKNLHKYRFDNSKSRHRGAVYTRHAGYGGQRQGLLIAEYLGTDEDIKISFWDHADWKWVESEKLVETVHEVRKPAVRIYLEKFKQLRITN